METPAPYPLDPALLAPGDARSAAFDWTRLRIHRITGDDHPRFAECYQRLWVEFGAAGEMEQESVIRARLRWSGQMRYEMTLVETADGAFAAVRDHTVIVRPGVPGAVVHLSHLLIDPAWRRSGLAGWMRAIPIVTARQCLGNEGGPVTLVAEMEPPDGGEEARMPRLRAYEKAGYLKVDPAVVKYYQPDFRSPSEIDASGGPRPLPMVLVLRRVGREAERSISGRELRAMVGSLYQMYAVSFRSQDMTGLFEELKRYPADDVQIPLLPPAA